MKIARELRFLIAVVAGIPAVILLIVLLVGASGFVLDIVPRVRVNQVAVATGAIVLVMLVGALELLGRGFLSRAADGQPSSRRWRFRWSLAAVAALALMFATGYAAMALVRQAAWLARSREPLMGEAAATFGTTDFHLKQIALGLVNYSDTYQRLPPGGTLSKTGELQHGWVAAILPFLWYNAGINWSVPWDQPPNDRHFKCVLPLLINPEFRTGEPFDAQGFGLSHYAGNSRVLRPNVGLAPEAVTDGAANTILVGEVNQAFVPWASPLNVRDPAAGINGSPDGFGGGPRDHGAHVVMVDGSVRFLSDETDPSVLRALATPASESTASAAPGQ